MLKGKIQFSTNAQTHVRWDQDALDNCSPGGQIWGWSICSLEILHHDWNKINDEVLLIKQGIYLVSNMVVQVLQRCFKINAKVGLTGHRFL